METINYLKCTDCGKEWLSSQKSDSVLQVYYCDRCGKKRIVKGSGVDGVSVHGECFCGGKFKRCGEDILCPKCHGRNIVSTTEIAVLWG